MPFKLRRLRHGHSRDGEHIFDEDSVARGRVVDQDVGDCSNELAVLNDLAAAHGCGQ